MYIKKKGFTLIELLAVIVILIVILAITIPAISGLIEMARKKAFESDAINIIKIIDYEKISNPLFDENEIDEENMEDLLDIPNDNYDWIEVSTDEEDKTHIVIIGDGEWDGLVADGNDDNIIVLPIDQYNGPDSNVNNEIANSGYPYLQNVGINNNSHEVNVPDGWIGIYTAEDLYNTRNNLTGKYIQMNSVDLSGYSNWVPIGTGFTLETSFQGEYNGNNYIITGINSIDYDGPNTMFTGLFGSIRNSHLKNINIVGAKVKGSENVGGLAGYAVNSFIDNCRFNGKVTGEYNTGGLVGSSYDNHIVNSNTKGSVYGSIRDVGGLVGDSDYNTSNPLYYGIIERCYSTMNVFGGEESAGGLVGILQKGKISKSFATGDVSNFDFFGGGLVGNTTQGTVENCYAFGDVMGTDISESAGGLIGDIGGLACVGCTTPWEPAPVISNSYSIGRVSGGTLIGGLIGSDTGLNYGPSQDNMTTQYAPMENLYYNRETSGVSDIGKGFYKTTTEMKIQSTYNNWDFVDIWGM